MAFLQFLPVVVIGSLVYLFLTYLLRKRQKAVSRIVIPSARDASQKKVPDADYTNVFPPSQRHTLCQLIPNAENRVGDISTSNLPLLTLECDYRLADPSTNIYSGFTVGEIRALGPFPDYAKLSGVPAPTPLRDFNIKGALPRPYRPFRWPYHQTMCM
jgi:hypothetical protein